MKKLKIFHVLQTPSVGGAEMVVEQLHSFTNFGNHFTSHIIYLQSPSDHKLNLNMLSLGSSSFRNPIKIFSLFYKFFFFRHEKILVHAHLTWPLYLCCALNFFYKNIILVATEHSAYHKRRRFQIMIPIEKFVYGRYRLIFCISETVRVSLFKWLQQKDGNNPKMLVVHNGARQFVCNERESVGGVRILSIGGLSSHKGFDKAIKSVDLISHHLEHYKIVGAGKEEENLRNLIRSHCLEEKIKIIGNVSDPTEYICDADLGLIPSLWEGFSLVAVELLSSGIPIMVRDLPIFHELYGKSKAVFYFNEETFVQKFNEFLGLRTANFDFSTEAKVISSRFSIARMSNGYLDTYRKLF